MLKLSKKGNYALKTIIYLANSGNNSFLKIATISKDLNISESLLRRIISELEKSGIVKTTKGRNGGIQIGKNFSEISVFDVLLAVDEELGITDCTKGLFCENQQNCDTTTVYKNLQKGFNGILKLYTLDKIAKNK
ncbi:hypothetical protein BLD25_01840 [Candidatus Gracilibacteria bacterium GN02-872]|nr:hypothetical protein BLD25_01840 [Candidatus Gracilibacteria bacterium GN02-872]RKW23381.1 MAG: Rrf2 family transcriptional regulator [Candidatus Gracilibacteria bacterium]